MLSKALAHYPQFRFREGTKRLWNPILKQTFVPRPEERVRLALIDYLTLEAGFSASRISFESPVKLIGDKSSSRTDIICYSKKMEPELLVECKAPDITLNEKAAIQVARYNQEVGASQVLVSNGMLDYWFSLEGGEIQAQKELPEGFQSVNKVNKTVQYWQQRAFMGNDLGGEHEERVKAYCEKLFGNPHQPVKYISFDSQSSDLALNHYYRIFGLDKERRLGVTFSANARGESRMNAILNDSGQNTAFISCSLEQVWQGEKNNSICQSARGEQILNLNDVPGLDLEAGIEEWVGAIGDFLHQYS